MIKFLILYLYQSSIWLKDIYKLLLQHYQRTDYVWTGIGWTGPKLPGRYIQCSGKNSWRPSSLSS